MHFNGVMMHFNGVVGVYTLFIVVGIWAILFPSGITNDAIPRLIITRVI